MILLRKSRVDFQIINLHNGTSMRELLDQLRTQIASYQEILEYRESNPRVGITPEFRTYLIGEVARCSEEYGSTQSASVASVV